MFITINVILFAILVLTTVDSVGWSLTIWNHSSWALKNKLADKRHISFSALRIFSIFSGIFSFSVWCAYSFLVAYLPFTYIVLFILFMVSNAFQIINIHTWQLISSYICIPSEFTPYLSRQMLRLYNKITPDRYTIKTITLDKWEEIFDKSSERKTAAMKFIDIIPDLIWIKDEEDRFLYANAPMCKEILLSPEKDVINKTSLEVARDLKDRGIKYTFGEICLYSDEVTRKREKPTYFYKYGIINDKYVALRIIKAPLYKEGKLIGTLGYARDVTYHNEIFEKIESLFNESKYEEARNVFAAYKAKYEDINEIESALNYKEWEL